MHFKGNSIAASVGLCISVIGCIAATNTPPQGRSESLAVTSRLDSVAFVDLGKHASRSDCSESTPNVAICRVRRRVDARALANKVDSGVQLFAEGNELTAVYRSKGESVDLTGGIQFPLSPVVGTDLWTITLRIPNLDKVVDSYAFVAGDLKPGTRLNMQEWRGPLAPRAAAKAAKLAGTVRIDTLSSKSVSGIRTVISYIPPVRGNEPIFGVIYMGDGGAGGMAPYIDTLITTGKLPRVMLVSIPPGQPQAGDAANADIRAMEYLWGYEQGNAHFLAHEQFFLDEVIPFAEKTLGAPASRENRAVWGGSNSAAWAISMGLRHPEVIGNVLAYSPGGAHGVLPPGARFDPPVRFLLQGGVLEPAFHRIALDWNDTLQVHGLKPTLREVIAGHDWLVWCEEMKNAILWAWPSGGRVAESFRF